jgi:dTDP-L-rhamnose 4-epimerase
MSSEERWMSQLGTVLVTGGAGFIGCALSQELADQADRWVVLDNLHPQVHARPERPTALHRAAELVVGDVTHPGDWSSLLADCAPDIVVHLAAETGTAQSLTESSRHGLVNVVGTTQMLDAFTGSGRHPTHVVLASSRAVYGEGTWRRSDGTLYRPGQRTHEQLTAGRWDFPDSTPVPSAAESAVPAPTSVYGATKLAQEHILTAWAGAHDVRLSTLRLQNVYGPGQSLTNSYTGIVALFSRLARDGATIPLYEDGEITRDFVYILDVVSALRLALETPGPQFRTHDVGYGARTTIRDLAQTIADFYGAPAPEVVGKFRDGDVRHAQCDVTATTAALGWRPEWDLARGVAELQAWIATQLGASTVVGA